MVWIHGGGWIYEGTEDPLYSGARLAARGDVVVVSAEYRLGSFGFSHFPDEPGSGNAGLLDQRLALEWVRDHIAAFGGDPDDVTIFGESAGGTSVSALMSLPDTTPLFHEAIAQSNVALVRSTAQASRVSAQLMAAAGVDDVAGLRALSWEELLEAQTLVESQAFSYDLLFGPVVDGSVLPVHPLAAVAAGSAAHVPFLTGTTRHEARGWMVWMDLLRSPIMVPRLTLTTAAALTDPGLRPGTTIAEATEVYFRSHPGLAPNLVSLAVVTDVMFRLPVLRFASSQVSHQPGNVFVYRFDWEPPSPGHPDLDLGALHGAELGFMLGAPEGWPELYGEGGASAPAGLIDAMMDAWLSFAKTAIRVMPAFPRGHPTCPTTGPRCSSTRTGPPPPAGSRSTPTGRPAPSGGSDRHAPRTPRRRDLARCAGDRGGVRPRGGRPGTREPGNPQDGRMGCSTASSRRSCPSSTSRR